MYVGHGYVKRRGTSQGGNIQPSEYPGAPDKSGFLGAIKKAFDPKLRERTDCFNPQDNHNKLSAGGDLGSKSSSKDSLLKSKNVDWGLELKKNLAPQKVPAPCGLENLGNTVSHFINIIKTHSCTRQHLSLDSRVYRKLIMARSALVLDRNLTKSLWFLLIV